MLRVCFRLFCLVIVSFADMCLMILVVELVLDDLPIPRGGETNLDIWLNNGKAHVKTPESYILAPKVIINKEYDLYVVFLCRFFY